MALVQWFKKLFTKKEQRDPPFLVAKKPGVKLSDDEKIEVPLVCPMCHTYWADATVYLGANVSPENFRVKEPYKSVAKVEAGKTLVCPACQYIYTGWTIHAAVLAALNKQKLEESTNGRTFGHESKASEPESTVSDKSTSD